MPDDTRPPIRDLTAGDCDGAGPPARSTWLLPDGGTHPTPVPGCTHPILTPGKVLAALDGVDHPDGPREWTHELLCPDCGEVIVPRPSPSPYRREPA